MNINEQAKIRLSESLKFSLFGILVDKHYKQIHPNTNIRMYYLL